MSPQIFPKEQPSKQGPNFLNRSNLAEFTLDGGIIAAVHNTGVKWNSLYM
jgi:hypothetical protein